MKWEKTTEEGPKDPGEYNMMNNLKMNPNSIPPGKDGTYFAVNHKGIVGVVELIDGKWWKVSSEYKIRAAEDEIFCWIKFERG